MTRQPVNPPAKGQETAQWVLDIIENNPEQHNQEDWESERGTTRCVAGWAVFAHYGAYSYDAFQIHGGWQHAGRDLLGINSSDASGLFYANDEDAVEALRYVANGKEIDWEKVMGK